MKEQWQNIIVEGDAQLIIKAINQDAQRGLYNQVIIDSVRSFIQNFNTIPLSSVLEDVMR